MKLEHYLSGVAPAGAPNVSTGRSLTAQLVPFGRAIDHDGLRVQFDPGSLRVAGGDEVIPLTVDHADGSTSRIGKLTRFFETDAAAFGEFAVSETKLGADILTLLHDGVLTDGSVGVLVDAEQSTVDAAGVTHRVGTLDHFSIVPRGSFDADARILSVHEGDATMAKPTITTEPAAEPAVEPAAVAAFDAKPLEAEIARLSAEVDALGDTRVTSEPELFANMKEFVLTVHKAGKGNAEAQDTIAKHVAQLEAKAAAEGYALDTADTTDAAGFVPDYLSSRIIGLIDDFRPSVGAFDRIDAGPYGMSVVLPKVTVKPDVDVQSSEFVEPASTAMDISSVSFDLETYAGAGVVSVQLIERSQPSYVDRLIAELAGVYASRTDAAFIAALVAGVGTNTAVVADLGADAAATYAAILAGVGAIAGDIKRAANRLILGTTRWVQLMSLVDSEGRPLILPAALAANPQGTGEGDAWRFRYFPGLVGIHDPHAAATSCLIGWSGAAASIETQKQQVRAVQVASMGVDIGVWGLFTDSLLYAGNVGGLYSITAA